jgi:tetratricopeptide (TPR) repeat protein
MAIIAFFLTAYAQDNQVDSLLSVYDYEIDRRDFYLETRQKYIDSIKMTDASASKCLLLSELYRPYQSDSAIAYLYKVIDQYPSHAQEAQVRLLYLFSSIGMFVDGFDLVDKVCSAPDSLRIIYYEAKNRLYSWAANNVKQPVKQQQFIAIGQQYLDSMNREALLHTNDPVCLQAKVMRYREQGNYRMALAVNDTIMRMIPKDSHEYAMYTYQRYLIYKDMGQKEHSLLWLINSAIADLRCAVTDNGSSWVLANILYQQGEIERANKYIEYSLSNAAFYNAPIRFIQINKLAHTITNAYHIRQTELSQKLRLALFMAILVLVLLVAVFAYTISQNNKLRRLTRRQKKLNLQLESLSSKQQQYIAYFVSVYSEYIRRLSTMARRAGERDTDIFYRQELQKFYDSFDEMVLSIYPDFVNQFNALLSEDGRITPQMDGKLTTELRIYACVCMGMDNISQIAELLFYSPSTIYNYRVKVKNTALGDRDTFEQRVRQQFSSFL